MASHYSAYMYEAFGNALEQIKLRTDIPLKPLQPTQVRIKVASAALNPVDWKLIERGASRLPTSPTPENPFGIGGDVAGEIVEVGSGAQRLHVGDMVYGNADHQSRASAAEYMVLEERFVALKPSKLSFDEAAGVPLAGQTSYQALVTHTKLQPGERVLIVGASGGCGIYAVQIAKAIGAHVIATTSYRNVDFVRSLGADEVIDYTKTKWFDVLEPHSIDVIYDCGFDGATWNNEGQRVLKQGNGRFVSIGHPVLTLKQSPIGATYYDVKSNPNYEDLNAISKLIESDQLKVTIDSVYPFERYIDAMKHLLTGRVRGKIVIHVGDL